MRGGLQVKNASATVLDAWRSSAVTTWDHLVVSVTNTGGAGYGVATFYWNGALLGTNNITAAWAFNNQVVRIGAILDTYWGQPAGLMDEIRWASVARTAADVTTSYNNQYSPATFFAAGTVESTPSTGFSRSLFTSGVFGNVFGFGGEPA